MFKKRIVFLSAALLSVSWLSGCGTIVEIFAPPATVIETNVTEPAAAEIADTESVANEPTATETVVAETGVEEPAAMEAVSTEPTDSEPAATEAAITEPASLAADGETSASARQTAPGPVRVEWYAHDYIFADGTLTDWTAYEYDAAGRKTKKADYQVLYDIDGIEYEYHDELGRVRITPYYEPGSVVGVDSLIGWEEYAYDANGWLVSTSMYSPAGIWLPGEETANAEDVLTGWQDFENDADGNQIKATFWNQDGTVIESIEKSYDSDGHLLKETYFNPDGSPAWGWRGYEYEGGEKTRATEYNNDGSVANYTVYGYNEYRAQFTENFYADGDEWISSFAFSRTYGYNGLVAREDYYNTGGEPQYWLLYTY